MLNASKELMLYLTRNVFILDQLEMSYTGIKSDSDLKQFLVMNAIKEIIISGAIYVMSRKKIS